MCNATINPRGGKVTHKYIYLWQPLIALTWGHFSDYFYFMHMTFFHWCIIVIPAMEGHGECEIKVQLNCSHCKTQSCKREEESHFILCVCDDEEFLASDNVTCISAAGTLMPFCDGCNVINLINENLNLLTAPSQSCTPTGRDVHIPGPGRRRLHHRERRCSGLHGHHPQ